MNKPLILLSLFLIATICFVTMPSSAHADSQLDVLIKITQNTQAQIKKDIDQMNNAPQKIHDFYDSGAKQASLLIQAVENEDDVSAKQHFIDAMIAFKQASLAISENQPQEVIVDHSPIINKYATNIQKLKIISTKLKADIDFEKIDRLLTLAKANNAQGKLEQAKTHLMKLHPKVSKFRNYCMKLVRRTKFSRQNSLFKSTPREFRI